MKLKTATKRFVKGLYKILPLPQKYKDKLKDKIYVLLTPMIKETYMYKNWDRAKKGYKHDYIEIEEINQGDFAKKYIKQVLRTPLEGQNTEVYQKSSFEPIELTDEDIKYLAFYLPQFHSFEENDQWWGKGFTEWTNTTKAVPQFVGHYQPRLAGELGYYDLKNVETIKEQMKLAKHYGITGFCIYYYWFDGARLLEKPLDLIMQHKELDLPICLCWANENWTRRWDGKNEDILMAQNYDESFAIKFIKDIAPYFLDNRYIRIDGKPLFIVYNASEITDLKNVIKAWREYCREVGVGEIHLLAVDFNTSMKVENAGFDGFVEFPPHSTKNYELKMIQSELEIASSEFRGVVFDYKEIVDKKIYMADAKKNRYKGVMLGWDNTARNFRGPMIFHKFSFHLFKEWLMDVSRYTKNNLPQEQRYVFINAWNEWAEGTYLEPDRRCGYAALHTVRESILESRQINAGNLTLRENIEAYESKWQEVEVIFHNELDKCFIFLCDYIALLRSAEAHGMFFVRQQKPYYKKMDGVEVCLNDRKTMSSLGANLEDCLNRQDEFAFVILQYNSIKYTEQCINSIKRLRKDNIKIIVVDNNSEKEAKSAIQELYSNDRQIHLIFNSENLGFAKGNNVGYVYAREQLKAKFIVVINNDVTVPATNFLDKIEETYQEWSFSILGPRILVNGNTNQNPWNHYLYNNKQWQELLELYQTERCEYIQTGEARFARINMTDRDYAYLVNPILQGAAYILSPIFIEKNMKLFDECTFLYGEEFLLASNSFAEGHLMLYSDGLEVLHHEGITTAAMFSDEKIMNGYDNPILAIEKSIDIYEKAFNLREKRKLTIIKTDEIQLYLNTQKKNILMDLFFCQPGFHGGGEYGKTVFKSLVKRISVEDKMELWVAASTDIFMEEWIWDICRENRIKIIEISDYEAIAHIVNQGHFDTFFAPAIVVYMKGYEYMETVGEAVLFVETRTKVIGTLHDVRDYQVLKGYKEISEALYGSFNSNLVNKNTKIAEKLRIMYKRLIESPYITDIITVSRYSKETMKKEISEYAERVRVAYAPEKNRMKPKSFCHNSIDFKSINYALLIHADREEKNALNAIRAMDEIFDKHINNLAKDIYMVMTGVDSIDSLCHIEIKNKERFVCLGYVETDELEYLYQNAEFLLFASFNEGFGYPPIEAMSYGVSSVVSNVTSIPEVCGDAVVYCDPYDLGSIKESILEIMNHKMEVQKIEDQQEKIYSIQQKDLERLIDIILYEEEHLDDQ